jgi:hypothetical protein
MPCSPKKYHRRLEGTNYLHLQGQTIRQGNSSKNYAAIRAENFHQNVPRHFSEDSFLHYHRCENVKNIYKYYNSKTWTQTNVQDREYINFATCVLITKTERKEFGPALFVRVRIFLLSELPRS